MGNQDQGNPPMPLPTTDSGGPGPGPVNTPMPPQQPDGGAQDLINNLTNPEPQGRQINSLAGLMGFGSPAMNPVSNNPAPQGGGGGYFDMDVAEMQEVKNQWQAIKEKLTPMLRDAMDLSNVSGPGNEQASQDHAGVCTNSASAYQEWLQGIDNYVTKYVEELDKAINGFEQTDQANAADAERQY